MTESNMGNTAASALDIQQKGTAANKPSLPTAKRQQPEAGQKKSSSYEERKAQRDARNLETRLKRASDPNAQVLKSTTDDMYQFIALLRLSDNLLYQMRMKAGIKVPFDKVAEFFERQKKLKEELNSLNADISKEMGWDYETPKALQV